MRSWSGQSWTHICIMHLAERSVYSADRALGEGHELVVCSQVAGRGVKPKATLVDDASIYAVFLNVNAFIYYSFIYYFQSSVPLQDESGSPSSWSVHQSPSCGPFRSAACSPCGSGHGTLSLTSAPAASIFLNYVLLLYHLCVRTITCPEELARTMLNQYKSRSSPLASDPVKALSVLSALLY